MSIVWLKSHKIIAHGQNRPYSSWTISNDDFKRAVFQNDMPGVVNAGTDAFKRSDPGSARMPTPEDRVGELGMLLNMCRDDVQN